MIRISSTLAIDENEIHEIFIRSSGPGGQHVNKTATAVQLRFDAARSPSLPAEVRCRLKAMAGRRMSADGVLIIKAQRFRSREKNRQDALQRLIGLIRTATQTPKRRRPTRVPPGSRRNRLADKRHRSRIKRHRRSPGGDAC